MSENALEQAPSRSPWKNYGGLLFRYLRPLRPAVTGMAALLLASIALQLVSPQVIRYFLDTAQAGGAPRALLTAALLFITFSIFQQVLQVAASYTSQNVGWAATNQLQADLTLHCLRLDMPFHKRHTPGELIERIDEDITRLANFFSQFSVRLVGNGLLVLGILALLARENGWVGLGMAAYTLITLWAMSLIQRMAVPRWAAERQSAAVMYGYLEERISGAEEIRAAGAEAHAMRRLYGLMREFLVNRRLAMVTSSLAYTTTNLVYVIGYAAGLALGVFLYMRGEASLGTAYLIIYYVGMLSDPLQNIREQAEDFQRSTASLQRIQALFRLRPAVADPAAPALALPQGALGLAFEQVSFQYNDQEAETGAQADSGAETISNSVETVGGGTEPAGSGAETIGGGVEPADGDREPADGHALRGVSFEMQPGRVLGILGRTGSGKSTLTRLLFRLYDPSSGAIRLGGVDLRAAALADLRARVGMVTQDVQLFDASIRDNLTFFNPAITDERLVEVLQTLRLWDWVQGLPGGLDARLAAGGQGLSAGEAQLLAFARVFLKDPGLVILDEASSRLDPATESRMERAVDELFAGRTGLVIAHRLKTVQRADDILILEGGCVVEFGRRADLARDPQSRFYSLLQTGLEEALA